MTLTIDRPAVAARLTVSSRLLQRQPALKAALLARLDLPQKQTGSIALLRAAIRRRPEPSDADRMAIEIVNSAHGHPEIVVTGELVEFIVARLGHALPITLSYVPPEGVSRKAIAERCRLLPLSNRGEPHTLAEQTEQMRRNAVNVVLGGPQQEWAAGFMMLRRGSSRTLFDKTPGDFMIVIMSDGSTRGWGRVSPQDNEAETALTPEALKEILRAWCGNPEAAGFSHCDFVDDFAHVDSVSDQIIMFGGSNGDFYANLATASSTAKRAMRVAAAVGPDEFGRALMATAAYRMSMKRTTRRHKPTVHPTAALFHMLAMLGQGDAQSARRLQQAIAIAPGIVSSSALCAASAQGQSLAKAMAIILRDAKTGGPEYLEEDLDPSLPMLRRGAAKQPLLERAVKLGLPFLRQVCTMGIETIYLEYAHAMAAIGDRNAHIRPHSGRELKAIAKALRPNSARMLRTRRTNAQIARSVAARLRDGRVWDEPSTLLDVTKWVAEAVEFLELGRPGPGRNEENWRPDGPDFGLELVEAAAIRMGGWKGLAEIDRRWHERIIAFNRERDDILLAARPVVLSRDAHALQRRLTLPDDIVSGVSVSCLTEQVELDREGRELGHCVGGYASSVRSGHSFVLSLKGPGEAVRSTAELFVKQLPDGRAALAIRQHRAFDNDPPPARHDAALHRYMAALNANRAMQAGLLDAHLEAAHRFGGGKNSPYAAAVGDPITTARLTAVLERQLVEIVLPPSMKRARASEIVAFARAESAMEHLVERRRAA